MLNLLEARNFPANLTQKCGDVVIGCVKSAGGQEAPPLTILRGRVGPLEKDLTRAGGGEESGRLWEVQPVVFYTLRAGPPTQLSLVRVSF